MRRIEMNSSCPFRYVPVDFSAMAAIGDKACRMHVEALGPSRVFLRGDHHMKPLDRLAFVCWPEPESEPVYAFARIHSVERSWAGYLYEALFLDISERDWRRLDMRYRQGALAQGNVDPALSQLDQRWQPQVLVIGSAVSPAICATLRELGLTVQQVPKMAGALKRLAHGPEVVIANSGDLDCLALCQKLATAASTPDLLLLVDYASEQELDAYLSAGAARIILKPCEQETLVQRIVTALIERAELRTAAHSSAATLPSDEYPQSRPQSKPQPAATRKPSWWRELRSHIGLSLV